MPAYDISLSLPYGADKTFALEIEGDRVLAMHAPPEPIEDLTDEIFDVLETPFDFPALEQAVVPGDKIGIALDRGTPYAATIVAAVWEILQEREINAEDIAIVQPAALVSSPMPDPRAELPDDVRDKVTWQIHDPTDEKARGYLASTSAGDRIYLSRLITESDFVLPIGYMGFDSLLGIRGTNSVFYPGLSSAEAVGKCHGQGHRELGPNDERPLRQLVDEISWLLGVQFTIQVVPAANGQVAHVLAGAVESVLQEGKSILRDDWWLRLHERADIVVVSIDDDGMYNDWTRLGAALSTARNLVVDDGKIVVLSDLKPETTDGLRIVQASDSPRDALKPLRTEAPADLISATQIVNAADWANVYWLSQLEGTFVEDLFITPLATETEAARLFGDIEETVVTISAAQHAYGNIVRE